MDNQEMRDPFVMAEEIQQKRIDGYYESRPASEAPCDLIFAADEVMEGGIGTFHKITEISRIARYMQRNTFRYYRGLS